MKVYATKKFIKDRLRQTIYKMILAVIGVNIFLVSALYLSLKVLLIRPMNGTIEGLNKAADEVTYASGYISSASRSLAEGSSQQAAAIEETTSSLEEMSAMAKQNAENAGKADNLMKDTNQVVSSANESMSSLTLSMDGISRSSEETSKIIKTIDEIAFQTNLLALNAAVEAARAGEAGAGFAVVAEEVRNLAIRAADAAKNTANLIDDIVKKVDEGTEVVTHTNEVFTKVAQSADSVGNLVAEISASSDEQAEGVEQVNKAVVDVDKIVQKNAANAEESASASQQMYGQAEQMRAFVNELIEMVKGKSTAGGRQKHNEMAGQISPRKNLNPDPQKRTDCDVAAVSTSRGSITQEVIPLTRDDFSNF